MIKAACTDRETGELTLILGVTDLNLKYLQEGDPILIRLKDLGMGLGYTKIPQRRADGEIMICHGKDERTIAAQMGIDVKNPNPGDEL